MTGARGAHGCWVKKPDGGRLIAQGCLGAGLTQPVREASPGAMGKVPGAETPADTTHLCWATRPVPHPDSQLFL